MLVERVGGSSGSSSPAARHPSFANSLRWSSILAASSVLLIGCGLPDRTFPDAVTRDGDELLSLWWGSSIAALAVALFVWGLVAFAVVRYRHRRRDDRAPSQSSSNIPLEIAYTAIPLVIVAVLFGFSFAVQRQVTSTDVEPDLAVDVIGFQWQWQFRYPSEGITISGTDEDPAVLVLPVGQRVRLNLRTTDVIHSFWVPQFLTKRDMVPGVDNEIDLTVDEPGRWTGRCAEFCGLYHYRMNFEVRAVPPREYRSWVSETREETRARSEVSRR